MGTAHGGRAQVCTGGMEGPGKQYPCEKTGGLEPGRFKPIEEPGAEEKDPVVFTGLETVWVTVDKVGIPTFGLDGTGSARPPTLAPAPEHRHSNSGPPFSSFGPSRDYGMDLCLEVYL